MKKLAFIVICALALSSCGKKGAAEFAVKPDAAMVKELAAAAHKALTTPITDMSAVPPGAELPPPLENLTLSDEDQTAGAQRGIISAYAGWCGYDWQERSFGPFIAAEAHKRRLSDAQIDYLALIHTLTFQQYSAQLAAGPACAESDKAKILPHLFKDVEDAIPDAKKYPSE